MQKDTSKTEVRKSSPVFFLIFTYKDYFHWSLLWSLHPDVSDRFCSPLPHMLVSHSCLSLLQRTWKKQGEFKYWRTAHMQEWCSQGLKRNGNIRQHLYTDIPTYIVFLKAQRAITCDPRNSFTVHQCYKT